MTSTYRLIRSTEPLLRKAEAGRAIFFTTGLAREPRAFFSAYAASKAGLESLVSCWADEMEHTAVRTTLLSPGPMRTRMRATAFPGEEPEDVPPPEAIVPTVIDLARGDKAPPAFFRYEREIPAPQ